MEALLDSDIFRFVEEDRRLLESFDRACDEVGSTVRVVESTGAADLDMAGLRGVAEAEGWRVERIDREVMVIIFRRDFQGTELRMQVSSEMSRERGGMWTITAIGSC